MQKYILSVFLFTNKIFHLALFVAQLFFNSTPVMNSSSFKNNARNNKVRSIVLNKIKSLF